jgi:non-specific serine/threonine protein kinase
VGRLRREHANLRVALDYCATEPGEAVVGLRMATQLDDYWGIRGFHTEARHWLDNALSATPEPSPERASALRMDGWFALLQGDIEAAKPLLGEAAELAARLDYAAEVAYVTHAWGMASLFVGELDTAVALLDDALARFRAAGVRRGEMFGLFSLGITLGMRGGREKALALLDECLDVTSRAGDTFWRPYALWSVAHIEVLHNELDRAEEAGKEALRLQWQLDNKLAMAFSIDTLAWVWQRRGEASRAATLFGAASAVWHQIGAAPECYVTFATAHYKHLDRTRADLGEARFEAAFRDGYELPSQTAVDYALGESRRAAAEPVAPEPRRPTPLTRRERQIADLVAEGMSNKQIAAELVISQRTAEAHVEHILVKLEFNSRAQIAAWVVGHRSTVDSDTD